LDLTTSQFGHFGGTSLSVRLWMIFATDKNDGCQLILAYKTKQLAGFEDIILMICERALLRHPT